MFDRRLLVAACAAVLAGCGTMPQTPDEFRAMVPKSASGTVESFEVKRPFKEVAETFRKKGPECLHKAVMVTERGPQSNRTYTASYKSTFRAGPQRAELHVQQYIDNVKKVYAEPPGGYYVLVADAIPARRNATRIDLYRPKLGNHVLVGAVRSWASGQNLGCPDLTKDHQ